MNSFIVFSDLHAHSYKEFDKKGSRLDNTCKVIEELWIKADKTPNKIILFCGDLFDRQGYLPVEVVNKVHKTFSDLIYAYEDVILFSISGNHDHATKNTWENPAVTALTYLQESFPSNFFLLDNNFYSNKQLSFCISGIPYYENKDDFDKALDRALEDTKDVDVKTRVLMIHQTPKSDNNLFAWEIDPDDERLNVFDKVFCGHIHKREILSDKFTVVGTPLHRDRADEGESKGYELYKFPRPAFSFEPKHLRYSFKPYSEFHPLKFPEFKTLPEGSELPDDFHYYTIESTIKDTEQIAHTEFKETLKPSELMTNFFNKKSSDSELLEFGLKLLQ